MVRAQTEAEERDRPLLVSRENKVQSMVRGWKTEISLWAGVQIQISGDLGLLKTQRLW